MLALGRMSAGDLAKAYIPRDIEETWAQAWLDRRVFEADPARDGPPFSIVIPPPNITGQLHLGHALNNTLQDVLVRWRRMAGDNVVWIPGTDHASIATQNVVERKLAAEGLDRHGLGREAFLERTFEWKEEVAPYIVSQLKRLGAGCDWSRERFTMDEGLSQAVREVFVRLWEDGLIYRGRRMINWCCRCGTALSDIEVEHRETQGSLWHLRYPLADGSGEVVVATTRPETMLGDTAVAVHPDDPRWRALVGQKIRLPVLGREIPIIADESVDQEFGSGAVKITPAHDPSDFEMGSRHGLETRVVIDESGRMTLEAGPYAGLDRVECRAQLVAAFEADGTLLEVKPHTHAVGTCYRCHEIVEPMPSLQWFVRAKPLADPAIEAVREGRTRFHPEHWTKTYYAWLENIRDWCISRQLWWGHRIPAWYCEACGDEHIVVARETPSACPRCGGGLRQDEDVLDTWFSSALWPFSTLGWPEQTADLKRWYPTAVLVTGFDILFFWVARMMMMGLRFTGEVPFRDVYVHGLVRDEYGAKMSKSKGNVQDPLELLAIYGTDALRFTLMSQSAMGRDIRLSTQRIEGNRAFANKIWNASRFVLMKIGEPDPDAASAVACEDAAGRWIRSRLSVAAAEVSLALTEYRFNDASSAIYRFFWNEYCDWYLELAKLSLRSEDAARRAATRRTLVEVLETALRLLHPMMPFITEELAGKLPGASGAPLVESAWPDSGVLTSDPEAEAKVERLIAVVRAVRNIRAETGVAPSREVDLLISCADDAVWRDLTDFQDEIRALARLGVLERWTAAAPPAGAAPAVVAGIELHVPLVGIVDVAATLEKTAREIEKARAELLKVEAKLGREDFIARAPEEIVEKERERAAELVAKLDVLESALGRLGGVGA